MSYNKYLRTKHWQGIRKRVYDKNRKCKICKRKYWLNIHHLKYDNLFNEKDEDLVVLCRFCHKAIHLGIKEYQEALSGKWEKKKVGTKRPSFGHLTHVYRKCLKENNYDEYWNMRFKIKSRFKKQEFSQLQSMDRKARK